MSPALCYRNSDCCDAGPGLQLEAGPGVHSVPAYCGPRLVQYLELRFTMGLEEGEKNAFEESSKLAIEAIANIRTVQGLTCEQQYVQRFVTLLKRPHQEALIRNHKKAGLTML